MQQQHPASNALLPAGSRNLEVVLHDPRNQKMVVWDCEMGLARLQSTATAARICPFCQQELPDDSTQWHTEWQREQGIDLNSLETSRLPAKENMFLLCGACLAFSLRTGSS